jgi:hypothetical protein
VLTVAAVLALWFVVSVALGTTIGGIISLRGRDRRFDAARVHPMDAASVVASAS